MTEPELTTTMEAELRSLDEALASGAVTSGDRVERELQELALALRAEGAEPSPRFDAELRARVQSGFPRERRLPRPHLVVRPVLPRLRRPPLPVVAGLAAALVAIPVAVTLTGEPRWPRDSGQDGGGLALQTGPEERSSAPAPEPGGAGTAASPADGPRPLDDRPAPSVAPEPPPSGGFAPGRQDRRIERSAALALAAPEDRLERVAEGIIRLTDRYQGFVLRSSLSTGDEGTTGGDFELRIPAVRLQAALAELSKLAEVRSRTQNGQDVTPQFVSAEERLEGARAERRSLLRRLERAPNDEAAESIRRRLDLNAGEIRGLRGRVRDLRTRTNYASVTVTLQAEEGDGATSSPEAGDGLGRALDDALDSLGDSLEIAIRVLGVLLPLGLLTGALALAARAIQRRRREAALG